MELFSGIKSTYKKSEAAVAVQILLEHQAEASTFSLNPASLANKLVAAVWDQKPDIYDGRFGQRPHKLSVAATALMNGIDQFRGDDPNRQALILAITNLITEIEMNYGLYPFNSLDHVLLKSVRSALLNLMDISTAASAELKYQHYDTFEEWYDVYKKAAGEVNPQLEVDQNNESYLDFMEHEPLQRAFRDGVEPKSLARAFARQFDVFSFGQR
jgi:hypothetical protein